MGARSPSKRAPVRTVVQVRDADFREACARVLVSADELLEALRKVVLERELERLRGRIDRLMAHVRRIDGGDPVGFGRCYELFRQIDRLDLRRDAVFAELYGVTTTGERAPSSAQPQQKATAGRAKP